MRKIKLQLLLLLCRKIRPNYRISVIKCISYTRTRRLKTEMSQSSKSRSRIRRSPWSVRPIPLRSVGCIERLRCSTSDFSVKKHKVRESNRPSKWHYYTKLYCYYNILTRRWYSETIRRNEPNFRLYIILLLCPQNYNPLHYYKMYSTAKRPNNLKLIFQYYDRNRDKCLFKKLSRLIPYKMLKTSWQLTLYPIFTIYNLFIHNIMWHELI